MIKTLRLESETKSFFSEKEAMVVTNTPVKKRDKGDKDKHRAKRRSLPTLRCDSDGCFFTCKYGKVIKDHS